MDARGFFKNLVQRAGSHFKQFITVGDPPFVGQAILPADSLSAGPAACKAAWFFAARYTLTTGHGDWRMMA